MKIFKKKLKLKLKINDLVEIHAYQSIFLVKIKEIFEDRISGSFILTHSFNNGIKTKQKNNLKEMGDFLFKDIHSFKIKTVKKQETKI